MQVRPGRDGGILNPPVSNTSEVRSMTALMETAIGNTVQVKSGGVITELTDGVGSAGEKNHIQKYAKRSPGPLGSLLFHMQ